MTSSHTTHFLSEVEDLSAEIPVGKLAYLQERTRNNLYHFVLSKFLESEATRGLTKAQLARRIHCDPAQLNRLLGAPGNWTIDTISDLLAGIAAEELNPDSSSLIVPEQRNYTGPDWLRVLPIEATTTTTNVHGIDLVSANDTWTGSRPTTDVELSDS